MSILMIRCCAALLPLRNNSRPSHNEMRAGASWRPSTMFPSLHREAAANSLTFQTIILWKQDALRWTRTTDNRNLHKHVVTMAGSRHWRCWTCIERYEENKCHIACNCSTPPSNLRHRRKSNAVQTMRRDNEKKRTTECLATPGPSCGIFRGYTTGM